MPDPYKSEDTQLAVGVESAQGSMATVTRAFGKVSAEATPPDPEIDWQPTRVIGGGREVFQKHEGQHTLQGGSVPIILYDGAPLAYLFGEEEVHEDEDIDGASEAGTTTHVFTAKQNAAPPTQTIEATYFGRGGGDDFVRSFIGCAPNSGELSTNNDDELTAQLDYWAMSVDTNQTATTGVGVLDRNPWLFADASSQLTLFDTEFARFQSFSLSVENNLEEGRYIVPDADHPTGNSREAFELTYGNMDYTLNATVAVSDDAIYEEMIDPTTGGFDGSIEFTKPTGETLRIELFGLNIDNAPHPLPEDATKIEVELEMTPERDEDADQPACVISVEDYASNGTPYLAV